MYKQIASITCLIVAGCFSAGCASMTHFNDTRSDFDGRRVTSFLDAKQRAVTVVDKKDMLRGGELSVQMCSEPSPDALSALAASQGLNVTGANEGVGFTNALSESAAMIGLRTQSIQLMRDAMYRLCEAALSGYVNPLAYEVLFRRYQASMVTVLAIEQLTGAVRSSPVVLSGNASSGNAEEAAKLTQHAEKQAADVETSKKEVQVARAVLKSAEDARATKLKAFGKPEGELTDTQKKELADLDPPIAQAKDTLKQKEETLVRREQLYAYTEKARNAVLSTGSSASSSGEIQIATIPTQSVQELSQTVRAMVQDLTKMEPDADLCAVFFTAVSTRAASATIEVGGEDLPNPIFERCEGFAPATIKRMVSPQ